MVTVMCPVSHRKILGPEITKPEMRKHSFHQWSEPAWDLQNWVSYFPLTLVKGILRMSFDNRKTIAREDKTPKKSTDTKTTHDKTRQHKEGHTTKTRQRGGRSSLPLFLLSSMLLLGSSRFRVRFCCVIDWQVMKRQLPWKLPVHVFQSGRKIATHKCQRRPVFGIDHDVRSQRSFDRLFQQWIVPSTVRWAYNRWR